MATAKIVTNNEVECLFENLEVQKSLLTECINLYQSLTSHFKTLQESIDSKNLTLDSQLTSLDLVHQNSLDDLLERQNSIPDRLSSLSSEVESKKESAIADLDKPLDENVPFSEAIKSLCRRMDHSHLLRFVILRRKEMVRGTMAQALKECLDPPRMVLESVKEFLEVKAKAKGGIADKRWACGVVLNGLFPLEDLKKKSNVDPVFSRKTVEEAEAVVRDWRAAAEKADCDEGGGIGSAEAVMFLQVVVGFGLKGMIEEEYCKNLVIEFAGRRDMAKLAVPIYGDEVADLIDQLVKNGKEVEAIYFASESNLTERFLPVSLLKSYLRESKKKAAEMLKKSPQSAAATDEANNFETNYLRSIVRCVEDHKLEAEFSVDGLKKRLSGLEKAKADKKRSSAASSKPSTKRAHSSGFPPWNNGANPPRPAKVRKFPTSYPPPYSQREAASPARSPVSRYLGSYSLSGNTAYDSAPALTVSSYGPSYGATHIPTAGQITQQHYGMPAVNAPSSGPEAGSSYVLQSPYGVYDYGAAMTSNYQPPYTQ